MMRGFTQSRYSPSWSWGSGLSAGIFSTKRVPFWHFCLVSSQPKLQVTLPPAEAGVSPAIVRRVSASVANLSAMHLPCEDWKDQDQDQPQYSKNDWSKYRTVSAVMWYQWFKLFHRSYHRYYYYHISYQCQYHYHIISFTVTIDFLESCDASDKPGDLGPGAIWKESVSVNRTQFFISRQFHTSWWDRRKKDLGLMI